MMDTTFSEGDRRSFPVTQWTVVVVAGGSPSPEAAAALERLCAGYWYPLYAFVRRSAYSPADAEDLTQEFFTRLLQHNWIARANRERGRFRSFLLMAMKRFMSKEWAKVRTLKRGGQVRFVPFEFDVAEARYSREPVDLRTPEQLYDQQWALALLAKVLKRLRDEYACSGKEQLFKSLEPCLIRGGSQTHASLGVQIGMTEAAVKMAVCRLRQRYRECLKEEISETVASPAEVEEEIRELFLAVAQR